MEKRWNHERILLFGILLIAVGGFFGGINLSIVDGYNVGPGAAPVIYATCVIVCTIALLIRTFRQEKPAKTISFLNRKGFMYIVLCVLFPIAVYLIGFLISLLVFSAINLVFLEKIDYKKALPLAIIWSIALFWVFKEVFSIPLFAGILFN